MVQTQNEKMFIELKKECDQTFDWNEWKKTNNQTKKKLQKKMHHSLHRTNTTGYKTYRQTSFSASFHTILPTDLLFKNMSRGEKSMRDSLQWHWIYQCIVQFNALLWPSSARCSDSSSTASTSQYGQFLNSCDSPTKLKKLLFVHK